MLYIALEQTAFPEAPLWGVILRRVSERRGTWKLAAITATWMGFTPGLAAAEFYRGVVRPRAAIRLTAHSRGSAPGLPASMLAHLLETGWITA